MLLSPPQQSKRIQEHLHERNRCCSYSGAMGQAFTEPPDVAPNAADQLTGEVFGRRVAEAAVRWAKGA